MLEIEKINKEADKQYQKVLELIEARNKEMLMNEMTIKELRKEIKIKDEVIKELSKNQTEMMIRLNEHE